MKKSYGGRIGNVNIIQKVNRSDEIIRPKWQKTILVVNNELLELQTWKMKKDFIETCQKVSNIFLTALNEMYQELAGDNSKASNKLEEKQWERLVEILASQEEEVSLHDMRYFIDKERSTVSDEFLEKVKLLFEEYTK